MKIISLILAALLALLSLTGCTGASDPQGSEDICPGKLIGDEGVEPVRAAGLDPEEDMGFATVDTDGNPVDNRVFAEGERGVWLLFWQTDSEKSAAALAQLEALLPQAEENGYQIVGVVMDGGRHPEEAAQMTGGLHFVNLVWNEEMAKRYDGIMAFFDGTRYEADREDYEHMDPQPVPGDPVSTRANSRGQIQTSCTLVPLTDGQIVTRMRETDSNMTYEELLEESRKLLEK